MPGGLAGEFSESGDLDACLESGGRLPTGERGPVRLFPAPNPEVRAFQAPVSVSLEDDCTMRGWGEAEWEGEEGCRRTRMPKDEGGGRSKRCRAGLFHPHSH